MKDILSDETLLARWLNDQLSPEELSALRAHEAYDDLVAIVEEMDQLQPDMDRDKQTDYSLLRDRLQNKQGGHLRKIKRGQRLRLWAAAAAVILLLVSVATWSLLQSKTVIQTGLANQQEISLPDASTVSLAAQSMLRYQEKGFSQNRELWLEGEAYFTIQAGSSFQVYTSAGEILVTGTQFNVYARANLMEVVCTEGSVKVRNSSGDEATSISLSAGKAVRIIDDKIDLSWDLNPTNLAYFKTQVQFKDSPLDRVFADLERHFDIQVEYTPQQLPSDNFTGYFTKGNLEEALRNIAVAMDMVFEQDGKIVRVK